MLVEIGKYGIFEDKVRCAPILQAIAGGQYDYFLIAGSSARVRDTKTGYFRFVINDDKDIKALTEDIRGLLHRFIVVDSSSEESWRALFPHAEYNYFRMSVVTNDLLPSLPASRWPRDVQIVPMDESWAELVIASCACEEFPADSIRSQIKENLSLGLMWKGKQSGFYSKHLNGEMGPFWVAPELRLRGFGTLLKQEYLRKYLVDNAIGFGLITVENEAIIKTNESLGIRLLEKNILHLTVR